MKTNAHLTYPAIGKGPFSGVLLIHGSGAHDKNETSGYVHKSGVQPPLPTWVTLLSAKKIVGTKSSKRVESQNKTKQK